MLVEEEAEMEVKTPQKLSLLLQSAKRQRAIWNDTTRVDIVDIGHWTSLKHSVSKFANGNVCFSASRHFVVAKTASVVAFLF